MKQITMVIVVLMALIFSGVTSASGGKCTVKPIQKGEVINDICPVMGGEVDKDTPYKIEYKGKTIGFCCPGCIAKFNADPEKYMQKLQDKCIIKCPKCGAEIDLTQECKKMECPVKE